MRRYLPHRTSLVVIVAMLVGTSLAFGTARRVVDDNEDRLLADRAGDVAGLLESLGTSFEAQMASVAAVAQVTEGDVEQFRIAVRAADDDVGTSDQGGWALLRRTSSGYEEVTTVGSPTPARKLPAAWADGLDRAASGQFALLGFMGEGLERRFGMATGRAGVPGDLVVYSEAPLAGATTGATTDTSLIGGLAVAVYVGTEPDPDQVVLAFGDVSGQVEEVVVDIAGTEVLLQVSATDRLTGSLATNFPRILLGAGLLLALALASLVEITLRRRDDALATVSDLEQKNVQLDRAFAEQRAAEEARAALEADLQQAHRLESLGHLAGGVAHDFNNLLAAILSYADLVEDTVRDPQATEDLEQIRGAARRGAALTRQLLQFSRHAPVEPALVDVNDQVRELTTLLVRTLGEDVNLRTALAADPAMVLADPHELDQVLLNLVVNARDAIDAGGSIAIETGRIVLDAAAAQQYPNLLPGPHVRFVVRDDGCGMEPEVAEHAFEPFFTTKGRGQGTGLGLATAYGIVQRHAGSISLTSTPGQGTAVEVLLPAAERPAGAPVPAITPASRAPRPTEGRTVLVVEDEAPVRRALRRMLERAGYRVLEAEDGGAAVDRYGSADIDLLLTDLIMPGAMTGVDVAGSFRSRTSSLPVLYMSGYGADLLDGHGVDGNNGDAVLAKPFSEQDLLTAVHAALGSR